MFVVMQSSKMITYRETDK